MTYPVASPKTARQSILRMVGATTGAASASRRRCDDQIVRSSNVRGALQWMRASRLCPIRQWAGHGRTITPLPNAPSGLPATVKPLVRPARRAPRALAARSSPGLPRAPARARRRGAPARSRTDHPGRCRMSAWLSDSKVPIVDPRRRPRSVVPSNARTNPSRPPHVGCRRTAAGAPRDAAHRRAPGAPASRTGGAPVLAKPPLPRLRGGRVQSRRFRPRLLAILPLLAELHPLSGRGDGQLRE